MATVSQSAVVPVPLAEAWELYFEPRTWAAWVDGFASVISASEAYPRQGSTLRWRSVPAGRGEVAETVLEHEPRARHRIAFEDPQSTGELTTTFAIEPAAEPATRVALELSYRLRSGGLFAKAADFLFVRGQMRRSLARTLGRYRVEAAGR